MPASEFPSLTTQRLRPLLAVLRGRGIDIDARLSAWGTDEATLLAPLHRMPRQEVLALLDHLGVVHEPGELGLDTADAMEPRDLDLIGHLLGSASTLGDALRLAVRYIGLVHDGVELELRLEPDQARVLHRIAGGRVQLPAVADFSMAMLVRVFRDMTARTVPLLSVRLARPRPPNPARYRAWFGAPVSFEADCNEVCLPLAALDLALPRADASLHAVLERQARALLPAPTQPSFVERVRKLLAAELEHASAARVARPLRVAERTLRRRLEESNTSYRALLDDVRRERALVLAKDPRLNMAQVAQQLGFASATSFGRAFRRWTGMVPTRYARIAREA